MHVSEPKGFTHYPQRCVIFSILFNFTLYIFGYFDLISLEVAANLVPIIHQFSQSMVHNWLPLTWVDAVLQISIEYYAEILISESS